LLLAGVLPHDALEIADSLRDEGVYLGVIENPSAVCLGEGKIGDESELEEGEKLAERGRREEVYKDVAA